MPALLPDIYVQIDVKNIKDGYARCVLSTGQRDVQIVMLETDYQDLIRDGFFARDGKGKDSANIINTTAVFVPEK